MTYYAKSNYIQYDEWFDKNIDPMDLEYEKERKFSNSAHEKFYMMSRYNLMIGGSDVLKDIDANSSCSDGFCPITDEELKKL